VATVEFREVRKVYPGGFEAIKGVNLGIEDGEFIVIVGPSGCGKSTLLRMVAGLETISGGQICIDSRVVNNLEPGQRDIAMVFQNYALYPHMNVRENMSYGLKNHGFAKDEIDRRVQEAAQILELSPLLERKPREMSGGQRQRVAMGRAIVREPKAFLFDEPLSNLDAKLRVQMRLEIKSLQKRLGTTSIYVTHDQVEAMTLADRLVVMNGGIAEQIGTPAQVYDKPSTTFVASFIGSPSMNLLSARFQEGKVLVGDISLDLDVKGLPGQFEFGIRPEHMDVVPGEGDVQMKVELVEELGADSILYGNPFGTKEFFQARVNGKSGLKSGDTVGLRFHRDSLHFFDSITKTRLNL